jgi:hypothetical protein
MVNSGFEAAMRSKQRNAVTNDSRPPIGRQSAESTRHERVSSSASPEALKSALSSPTDVGGVATLLSDLAPLGVDLTVLDPFVEAMARGAAIKQELLTTAGAGLTSSQVSSALGIYGFNQGGDFAVAACVAQPK